MENCTRVGLLLVASLLFSNVLKSQQDSTWQLNGNLGIYGDFYSMHADTPDAVAPRRPGSMGRFIGNISIDKGNFSMPVTWMFSRGQQSIFYPNSGKESFADFIRNPANRISVSPTYKWAQLVLGTQIPQYSELSVGDLPVFGVGVNLRPGRFRFSASAGTTQIGVEEDTLNRIQGIYSRKMYSAKIGVGDELRSHIYLITSVMQDDTNSLSRKPVYSAPQKGALTSIDYRLNFGERYFIRGEVAASAFTRDLRSKAISSDDLPVKVPNGIFTIQESSRFDYAAAFYFHKTGKIFGFKTGGKYIGDGFVPLGYPFLQTDRADFTFDPYVNLNNNKVRIAGSVGRRVNNLSGIRSATTTQTIGSAFLSWQITERWSFSSSFSNFDFRNSLSNDTLRLQMVTLSWSVSPTYTYTTEKRMHLFSASYAQNAFRDFNTISGALNDNDAHNASISYMLSNLYNPFSITGMYNYFDNFASFGTLVTHSFYIGAGYKFFNEKLAVMPGFNYCINTLASDDAGTQLLSTLGLKYSWKRRLDLGLNGSLNLFAYGDERPGISYRENLLRTSLTYKF